MGIATQTSDGLKFSTTYMYVKNSSGTTLAAFKSDGNVGINTTSPSAKLHIQSDGSHDEGAEIVLKHGNNNTTDVVSTISFQNSIGQVAMIQGGTTGANNTGYISFFTDNAGTSSEKMRIMGDGNIGIGTTDPSKALHVIGPAFIDATETTEGLTVEATTNASITLQAAQNTAYHAKLSAHYNYTTPMTLRGYGGIVLAQNTGYTKTLLYASNAEQIRITTTGVGIGLGGSDPTNKLHVIGTTRLQGDTGIGIGPSSSYRLSVEGTNNSPARILSTANAINFTLGNSTQTTYTNILFNCNSGNGQIWKAGTAYYSYGGASSLNIYNSNGKIAFHPSGNENEVVIQSDGDTDFAARVGIGGNHNDGYQLYVTGNSYFSSAITTGGQLRGTSNSSITSIENFILDTKGEDAPVINHQLNNDLALLRVKGNTVTYSGLSSNPGDSETDRFFEANSYFGDVAASEISNASTGFTITLDSLPRNLTYTTRVGISFATPSWRCSYVKIEVYRAGAWNTIREETSNSSATVYQYYNTGSSAISKIRYTLKTPVTTSTRIVSLFAFNYNSTGATGYYLSQAGGSVYGSLNIGPTSSGTLLEVGNDGNTDYALIGPTKIGGGMGHGDYAGFSHRDRSTTTSYALLQHTAGTTYLNSNIRIYMGVNNANYTAQVESDRFQVNNKIQVTNGSSNSEVNIYKSSGSNTDSAILRVGYDSTNSFAISRQRASSAIYLNSGQSGSTVYHQVGSATKMVVNATGVGANSDHPAGRLDVYRTADTVPGLLLDANRDGARQNFTYGGSSTTMGEIGMTYNNGTGGMTLWMGANLNSNSASHASPTNSGTSYPSWMTFWSSYSDYYSIRRIAAGGGTSAANVFYINSAGSVGIGGITNPGRELDVDGRILSDSYGFRSDTSIRWYYFDNYSGSNFMGRGGNAYTSLYDGGTLSMVWKASNVGIGTNSPNSNLHISYSSGVTDIKAGFLSGTAGPGIRGQNTSTTANTYFPIDFRVHDADARIAFQYSGTSNQGQLLFITENNSTSQSFGIYDRGDGATRVLVNDTTSTGAPNKTFEVKYLSTSTNVTQEGLSGGGVGDGILIYNAQASNSVYANLDFRARDADGRIAYQYKNATNVGDFHFITDNTASPKTQMIIKNDGRVGIGTYEVGDGRFVVWGEPDNQFNNDIALWVGSTNTYPMIGIGTDSTNFALMRIVGDSIITNENQAWGTNCRVIINNKSTTAGNISAITFEGGTGWYAGAFICKMLDHTNKYSELHFSTANGSSDINSRMVIGRTGNVGIGTSSSSSYKLEVNGAFAASSKSFVIDHPTKENKKLIHGSLEGPEYGVYYRGTTQSNTITLPDYWSGLVREDTITVQLTPRGGFQHLYVVSASLSQIVIGAAEDETIDCFYTIYGERADIDSLVVEKDV